MVLWLFYNILHFGPYLYYYLQHMNGCGEAILKTIGGATSFIQVPNTPVPKRTGNRFENNHFACDLFKFPSPLTGVD